MRKLMTAVLLVVTTSIVSAEHMDYTVVRDKFKKEYDPSTAQEWKGPVSGILVTKVESGSPGERLGITRGDIIFEMDGVPIRSCMTWAVIRNGRECEITVYKPKTHTTVKYKTGKGMLGVDLHDAWVPDVEYIRTSGMKRDFDWDAVIAIQSVQRDMLHILDEALARVPKESRKTYPLPELQQIMDWNEKAESVSRGSCSTVLKSCRPTDITPLFRHLGRRMLANGYYGEFVELSKSYPDIIAGDTAYSLDELNSLRASEDKVLSVRLDEIKNLGWHKLEKVSSNHKDTPKEWLDNVNRGKPFQFSIPSAHYSVISVPEGAHNTWMHTVLRFDDADDQETDFAKAVKMGFVVSKEEKDHAIQKVSLAMQTDGIASLKVYQKRMTYLYTGHKADNKELITADLIVCHDHWFYLINEKEVARGPIINPVRKECVYFPFIHFSGIQGEVRTLEIRTLEEK